MTYPPTTIAQAELLHDLVRWFVAGQTWNSEQRKDARILVAMLIDHSRAVEQAAARAADRVQEPTL